MAATAMTSFTMTKIDGYPPPSQAPNSSKFLKPLPSLTLLLNFKKHKRGTGSGDSYRVLLIDDIPHTEKLVAKVLPQAVPSITPDGARELFHKSREDGVAVVIITVKEHAGFYSK